MNRPSDTRRVWSIEAIAPRSMAAIVVLGFILVIAACAAPRAPQRPRPPRALEPRDPAPAPIPSSIPPESRRGITEMARSVIGTRYRFGGEGRSGFDCSGLTQFVFERAGLVLPRTTREQAESGSWVPLDALAPGDLVFFGDGGSPVHHVGVVTSRPGEPLRMVHASTSRGVVETTVTDSAYWLRRLRFGRRLLDTGS